MVDLRERARFSRKMFRLGRTASRPPERTRGAESAMISLEIRDCRLSERTGEPLSPEDNKSLEILEFRKPYAWAESRGYGEARAFQKNNRTHTLQMGSQVRIGNRADKHLAAQKHCIAEFR